MNTKELRITLKALRLLAVAAVYRPAFAAFDAYMVEQKRKLVLVDVFGNEVIHKYPLLKREDLKADLRPKVGAGPQLYLHRFVWPFESSPDGPSTHSHVGTTFSLMLRGRYREWYDGKLLDRRPGSINAVMWPKHHKIEWVQPDTWTLFLRLRVKDIVEVKPAACQNVCEWCRTHPEKSGGGCYNASLAKPVRLDFYSKQFDSAKPDGVKFPEWKFAGRELDEFIARRKRAARKLGIKVPVGEQAQLEFSRRTSKLPVLMEQESERRAEADFGRE